MINKKEFNVTVAWSGGKDSCLAFFKALKEGHCINSLLIMMTDEQT